MPSEIRPSCPQCGSHATAEIVYGLVDLSDPALREEVDSGRVVLEGCVLVTVSVACKAALPAPQEESIWLKRRLTPPCSALTSTNSLIGIPLVALTSSRQTSSAARVLGSRRRSS